MRREPAFGIILICAILLAAAASALAQGNENWQGYHPPGVKKGTYTGTVNDVESRGQTVYIAGDFDRVGLVDANNIAYWDGRRWHAMGEGVNGEIYQMLVLEAAVIVCGWFTEAGGQPAQWIARWEGGQWHRMGEFDFDYHVRCLEVYHGEIYAGGEFSEWGGSTIWHLARWNGAVNEWESPAVGGPICNVCFPSGIHALKAHTDGRLWVGGQFDNVDGTAMHNIVMWDEVDGWQLVGQHLGQIRPYDRQVTCLENTVGSIYIGGNFFTADGEDAMGLAYSQAGAYLHGIPAPPPGDYHAVEDIADYGNSVLVVTDSWLRTRDGVGGWNDPIGSLEGALCAHQCVEGLFAGGVLTGDSSDGLARWSGSEWLRVGNGIAYMDNMGDEVDTITNWDGDLFIGGKYTGVRSLDPELPDCFGTMLYDFGDGIEPLRPGLGPTLCSMVYQGQLYLGGEFNRSDLGIHRIARRVGDAWDTLGAGLGGSGQVVAYDFTEWQGHLIVGGKFTEANGLPCDNLVAWDGSFFSLVDDVDFDQEILSLFVFEDDLIVGGEFTAIDGTPFGRIARWDGASWSDMNGGFDAAVNALAVWNGELYAAGTFLNANGVAVSRIARWDGAAWQPLGAGLNADVLALQASDVGLFVGGEFTAAGGAGANAAARWTGAAWEPLGDGLTGGPNTPTVRDFEIHDNGFLYMVGSFHQAGAGISVNFARWSEQMTPVALASFDAVPEPGAVELRWRVEGDGIPELRLEARLGDARWEPDFGEIAQGEYRCRDEAAPLAGGGDVEYRLQGREAGEDWTLLRRVSVTVAPAPTAAAPSISVWPNPGNPRFHVELSLPKATRVRVSVMDIAGRRVATLHDGPMGAGERTLIWDGMDDAGRAQSSGVYLLDLRGTAGVASRRLVLLR